MSAMSLTTVHNTLWAKLLQPVMGITITIAYMFLYWAQYECKI